MSLREILSDDQIPVLYEYDSKATKSLLVKLLISSGNVWWFSIGRRRDTSGQSPNWPIIVEFEPAILYELSRRSNEVTSGITRAVSKNEDRMELLPAQANELDLERHKIPELISIWEGTGTGTAHELPEALQSSWISMCLLQVQLASLERRTLAILHASTKVFTDSTALPSWKNSQHYPSSTESAQKWSRDQRSFSKRATNCDVEQGATKRSAGVVPEMFLLP